MNSSNPTAATCNHVPGGSNVLYMDGHVEFSKYGAGFPMLKQTDENADMWFAIAVSMTESGAG